MGNSAEIEGGPHPENRERPAVETKTLSADEFEKLIYKDGRSPDKRFVDPERGGVFKYFDLSKLTERKMTKRDLFYPVVKFQDTIVGLSELERRPDETNVYWMTFLSIDPEYRGRGCASRLEEEVFKFAKEKGFAIESSGYSPEGWKKLKPLQNRLAEKYGVRFIDSEEIIG